MKRLFLAILCFTTFSYTFARAGDDVGRIFSTTIENVQPKVQFETSIFVSLTNVKFNFTEVNKNMFNFDGQKSIDLENEITFSKFQDDHPLKLNIIYTIKYKISPNDLKNYNNNNRIAILEIFKSNITFN